MAADKKSPMYTAGKLAEELGVPQGRVKKLIEEHKIQPDDVQRGCKYYGAATLQKLQAAVKKA
jgi:plasmid maintenance system antidote protein VapI